MEDRDKKLLKTYAENNMSMKKTGGVVYLHYNPIRTGEIIYIHPKGRFISVRTETAGGPVVENFRLCEVVM